MGFLRRGGRDLTPPPPSYGPAVPRPFSELLTNAPSGALETLARHARVPDAARERILELDTRTLQAQQYLADRGITGRDAFEVVQIREDFGPSAVQAYLGLPPTTADTAVLQDGRTGAELLIEELDLLLGAVRDLLTRAGEAGQSQLRANHRFLEQKYGGRDPGLEL